MKTRTIRIGGMTCVSCRNRIERTLKSTRGVEDAAVSYDAGTATVSYDDSALSYDEIKAAIEALDYTVLDEGARRGAPVREIIGTLALILSLYALLRGLGLNTLTAAFPLAEAGMGYGMLFLIGLITSVHCVAMCGGITLSQCLPGASPAPAEDRRKALFPALLYNAGRVISYTALGSVVGALGSVITLPGRLGGTVQFIAGALMVIMGINMLGFFPALRRLRIRLPRVFARSLGTSPRDKQQASNKNPLVIGLLNGLMPCGPLQAMQIYALSTGSPLAGALSMFLFSAGTVPLMFGIGALSSLLSAVSKGLTRRVMQAGAILVTVMGMTMFSYGLNLGGFSIPGLDGPDFAQAAMAAINPFPSKAGGNGGAGGDGAGAFVSVIENGVQIVHSTLSPGRYPAITVRQGIPVRWTINAPAGSINGCNNRMIIREYGIEHRFTPGENLIEFTPEKTGRFSYSCWMGMIRSSITVAAEGENPAEITGPDLSPAPAGVTIPADALALAEIREGGWQRVAINLRDEGMDPSIIVVQRGIPAVWIVNNDSLDPGNLSLIFPAYFTRLDIKQGENVIELLPVMDFDFSTGDNVFYGYVKVVEDLGQADIEAVKAEVSEFETLIYPESYFETAARGAACCGR
jgi:sulfite exporter TauE/SafE/copper chaperone CopZ/plastocyanin domain-containing protein